MCSSPSDADFHAPDAVLNSDDARPTLAGSNMDEGDARLCAIPVSPLNWDVRPRLCRIPSPDADDAAADVEGNGEARPCSAEVSRDSTVWVFVATDVPVAWATAAAWPPSPPGLMLCGGGVNGVSVVADA